MDLVAVEEIVAADRSALDRWRPGDAWLAGGTWLFSEPQADVRRLLDLRAFGWPDLTAGDDGLQVAATCTLARLDAWPGRPDWPAAALIGHCCRALLGSFKVWNTATVGGNLCLALPAGPMTSLAAALDGVLTVWGRDETTRAVGAADFVRGAGETVLEPGELVRSLLLPAHALRGRTAFRQLSLSPVGRSAAVVIGRRSPAGDRLTIALTASVPRPVTLSFEQMPGPAELTDALDAARLDYFDDPHGDPAWREHLTRMFAEEVRQELEDGG
jgi:CO/xanthine dehydrogenase FAD-binding subunit